MPLCSLEVLMFDCSFEPFLFPSCAWSFFGNRKAVKIFSDDERFKAIERTRDREDMFEEYLAELEKKVSFF